MYTGLKCGVIESIEPTTPNEEHSLRDQPEKRRSLELYLPTDFPEGMPLAQSVGLEVNKKCKSRRLGTLHRLKTGS